MNLRPYQFDAVQAVYDHLRTRDDNPCVVIPTGGGKTPIIASICHDAVGLWNGRTLVLAHVKELLEQSVEKLHAFDRQLPIGVYSAGLGRRDVGYAITVAGIQSVYQRGLDLGAFNLILIDEAHLIPPDGEGMYRQFINDARVVNPRVRIVGFTATPFRMRTGQICTPDNILNTVCYEIGVRDLIQQGYLCPLRSKAGVARADLSRLRVRAGEFVAEDIDAVMDTNALVMSATTEIVEQTRERKSVLVFACSVKHAKHIVGLLESKSAGRVGLVTGDTPDLERYAIIESFKRGETKFLVNVNVLTTGFDAPGVECVALLRPTFSPGLYYQMCGRGFRLSPGKTNCLVLDFGQNVIRHGPIDQIRVQDEQSLGDGEAPAKECPECHELIAAGFATCPECGHVFPPPEPKSQHKPTADNAPVLSEPPKQITKEVIETAYARHEKRNAPPDHPPTLRVDYRIGFNEWTSEWLCFDHPPGGYAQRKAARWWSERSNLSPPESVQDALCRAEDGELAPTKSIILETSPDQKFPKVISYELGEKPTVYVGAPHVSDVPDNADEPPLTDDDIPF